MPVASDPASDPAVLLFFRSILQASAPYIHRALLFLLLLSGLAGSGCVSHAPMSETVMFREPTTSPRHTSVVGVGGTLSVPVSSRQRLLSAETPDRPTPRVLTTNPNAGAYLALYDPEGWFAFSATAGWFLVGLDATVKVLPATYLTAAVSPPLPGAALRKQLPQIYFQRRVHNNASVGAAVGAGYRRELLFTDDDAVPVDIFGLRARGLLRMTPKNNVGMRVSVFGGMTRGTREPYVSLAFTFGGF